MPPQPKRNRCVILYDLNSENQRDLRRALLKIYSNLHFQGSKDLVNLVLVNSEETKNRKNQRSGKGYENIYEVNREGLLYDPLFVHDKIEVNNTDTSNWKEALRVALEILKEDEVQKVITYQILFLTDLSNSSESDENIDDIVQDLEHNNIFLYIVGPKVIFPRTITNFDELNTFHEKIIFEFPNANFNEAKEIVERCTNAVIADVKIGLQIFFNYTNPIGKQIWNVPLSFGTNIEYAVETSKFTESYKGFQLKEEDTEEISTVFIDVEDSTKTYDAEDVRNGILKHEKFVNLQSDDIFKINVERMFSLVFITKTKCIPEYMMKGPGCYTVEAAEGSSPTALQALLLKLDEKECSLIVKRVYAKNNDPVYMALIPLISINSFRAVQLPYDTNVPFDLIEQEPIKDELDVPESVWSFLDNVTVGSKNFALNCPMTPNVMCAARGESLINKATSKMLHETNLRLEEVDLDPFSTGIDAQVGEKLREMWPSRGPVEDVVDELNEDDFESDDDDDVDYF